MASTRYLPTSLALCVALGGCGSGGQGVDPSSWLGKRPVPRSPPRTPGAWVVPEAPRRLEALPAEGAAPGLRARVLSTSPALPPQVLQAEVPGARRRLGARSLNALRGVRVLAFQDRDRRLVCDAPGGLLVASTARLEPPGRRRVVPEDAPGEGVLAVDPAGAWALTGGPDQPLRLRKDPGAVVAWTHPLRVGPQDLVRPLPGAAAFGVSNREGIWVVARETGEADLRIPPPSGGGPVAFAGLPGGRAVLVATGRRVAESSLVDGSRRPRFELPRDPADLAVDPAGELLAVGYPDGSVELRELATGVALRRGRAHHRDLARLAFSASGRWLATASRAGKLRVFEVASGAERLGHEGHTGWVTSVSWHPSGERLATGSLDGSVRVWEAATGRLLERWSAGADASCVRYSPEGSWLAWAGKGGAAWVRPAAGGRPRRLGEPHGRRAVSPYAIPEALAFSPDGRRLVVAGSDWILRVFDPATGEWVARYAGHGSAVQAIAFAPDGQGVLSADEGGELHRWDPESGAPESRWPAHRGIVRGLVALPRGRAWSGGHDGVLKLWRGPVAQRQVHIPGITQVGGLALSPDGATLAVLDTRGPAALVDARTGAVLRRVADDARAFEAAFSPDGALLATAELPGTATLWEVAELRGR